MNTAEQNPFVVGAEVVTVNTHWHRRLGNRRKIAKVYKNGNFILEGDEQKRQWTPRGWRDHWTAHRAGGGYYRSEHLEVWSDKHVAELAERKKEHDKANTIATFQQWLSGKRSGDGRWHLTDEQVELLKSVMEKSKVETPA
jgi:hypothetical protein